MFAQLCHPHPSSTPTQNYALILPPRLQWILKEMYHKPPPFNLQVDNLIFHIIYVIAHLLLTIALLQPHVVPRNFLGTDRGYNTNIK